MTHGDVIVGHVVTSQSSLHQEVSQILNITNKLHRYIYIYT